MTQSAGTEGWDRFLCFAAHARTKPSFDVEEREYRLDVAERLGDLLDAALDGRGLERKVNTVFEGSFGTRMYELTLVRQNRWLLGWAQLDEPSLRTALAEFLTPDRTAQTRFEAFATVAAQAQPVDRIAATPELVLAFGSLFNFVVEPLSLPVMRSARYERLRAALGEEPVSGLPVAEQYRRQVAFAQLVQRRLQEAGIPVRDMLDVQSLIWSAGAYMGNWAPGARIGSPGRTQRTPVVSDRKHGPAGGESRERAYLSMCTIFRDKVEVLPAWIEFHRLAGVERFFLYDHRSSHSHLEVLAPWVEDGTVVLHQWPIVANAQIQIYDNCLELHGDESRWIAFIDLDEFLFSPMGRPVSDLMREYEGWPGVAVNLAQFDFLAYRSNPQGPVIENHLKRVHMQALPVVKSIVDPEQASHCAGPHHFIYKRGFAVDENGHPVRRHRTLSSSTSRLRVNRATPEGSMGLFPTLAAPGA